MHLVGRAGNPCPAVSMHLAGERVLLAARMGAESEVQAFGHDGARLWACRFGSREDDKANAIATAGSTVVVAGQARGAMPGQRSAGGLDAYVAMLRVSDDGTPRGTTR